MKIRRRVEVLTHIDSIKITNSKEQGMIDVQFNQWELVVFKFDWETFFVATANKKELDKFIAKKEKEHAKLNRVLTQSENEQEMKEFRELPTELEEIEVLFIKDIKEDAINMSLYIKNLLKWL